MVGLALCVHLRSCFGFSISRWMKAAVGRPVVPIGVMAPCFPSPRLPLGDVSDWAGTAPSGWTFLTVTLILLRLGAFLCVGCRPTVHY